MRRFRIPLSARVLALTGVVALASVIAVLVAVQIGGRLQTAYAGVVASVAPARLALAEAKSAVQSLTVSALELRLAASDDERRSIQAGLASRVSIFVSFLGTAGQTQTIDPKAVQVLNERFKVAVDLLVHWPKAAEEMEVQGLRFEAARDDLENRLNGAINQLGAKGQESIEAANADLDQRLRALAVGLIATIVVLFAFVASWALLGLSRPIRQLAAFSEQLSRGDYPPAVPAAERGDELGDLARGLAQARDALITIDRLKQEKAHRDREIEAEKADIARQIAHRFEKEIGAIAGALDADAEALQRQASAMTSLARAAGSDVEDVLSTSGEAFEAVRMLADAVHELGTSVDRMDMQVRLAAGAADEALDGSQSARQQADRLVTAVRHIGSVAVIISNVASQTNLLALNATIEAARSGEAGRGFAVVAQEVKGLAAQIGRGAAEISELIRSVETATDLVVGEIHATAERLSRVAEAATSSRSIVDLRRDGAERVERMMEETASNAERLKKSVRQVSQATHSTEGVAQDTLAAAEDLARQSSQLLAVFQAFVEDLDRMRGVGAGPVPQDRWAAGPPTSAT